MLFDEICVNARRVRPAPAYQGWDKRLATGLFFPEFIPSLSAFNRSAQRRSPEKLQ